MPLMRLLVPALLAVLMLAAPATGQVSKTGISEEHQAKARTAIDKALAYLRDQQDVATGAWNAPDSSHSSARRQVNMPAFTGLVINGMLLDPRIDETDASVRMGLKYLLDMQQPDGGIYDRLLPSYNTSIALSALSHARGEPRAPEAIARAQAFLQGLQWSEDSDDTLGGDEAPIPVAEDHPFYGGVGYGRHGRPDNSNMNVMLQAMHDSGLSPDDKTYQRALKFLERTQMLDSVNDMDYADGSSQGGFIYATVENAQSVDGRAGQSMAGTIEETMDDGTVVSRLRAYGSVTYAGFKSYVFANLDRDDERVVAAYGWIRRNYTVDENPGMGDQGLYYYFVTMARALDAWGGATIDTIETDANGTETTTTRNWREDLIDRLAGLQNADGSFKSVHDRWMENDPVLITAYALLALEHAVGNASKSAD